MTYQVKNHCGKLLAPKVLWVEYGDDQLFLKRLRIDSNQHPITGEFITSDEQAEFKAYYEKLIDE